jgi:hypothetical protein
MLVWLADAEREQWLFNLARLVTEGEMWHFILLACSRSCSTWCCVQHCPYNKLTVLKGIITR